MNSKNTFDKRRNEAKQAARFAGITQRNYKGKATMVSVPGHEAKRYDVIVKRLPNGVMVCECLLDTGFGSAPCKGSKFVCYHSLAAAIAAAADAGYKLVLCHSESDAKRLTNRFSGAVIRIVNKADTDAVFAVVFKEKKLDFVSDKDAFVVA